MESINIEDWLEQAPEESDVMTKNAGFYIPIEIIKPRLTYLDPNWSTQNFQHFYFQDHDGNILCSGNVELKIRYVVSGSKVIQRTIVGSATFDTTEYRKEGNTHFGQTCLSLCIAAAAKELGKYFGRDLNLPVKEEEDKIQATIKKLLG